MLVLAFLWIAAFILLGLAGLPVAARLFPRFPDRGASFAIPIALTLLSLTAFWVGHVSFDPIAIAAGAVVVCVAAVVATRYRTDDGVDIDWRRCRDVGLVFVAGFGLMLFVRALDPAIVPAGGEKFLDYGMLRTVLRADTLPPQDMWFAGNTVRYYYGDYLVAAILTRLTATAPPYAYNLVLAGYYGMLVTAAFGLSGAIADYAGRSWRRGGAFGALFVAFAGNLATPVRMLLWLFPRPLVAEYGHVVLDGIRAPYSQVVANYQSPAGFNFWNSRYVIPNTPDVFPMWTYVNGDLRCHMLSASFLLLVAGICFAYYRTPEAEVWRRRTLILAVGPTVAGFTALINTWCLPTTAGLVGLTLLFSESSPTTLLPRTVVEHASQFAGSARDTRSYAVGSELGRTTVAGGFAAVAAVVAFLWGSPFFLFQTPTNKGLGVLPPRSGLGGLVLVHGAFLGIFALYLYPRVKPSFHDRPRWRLAVSGAALLGALAVLALVLDLAAVALFGPFLVVSWLLLRRRWTVGFETVLFVGGLGMVLAVEFVYAVVWPYSPVAPRWNTIYKAYFQVWVLWGVATGVAVTRVLGEAADARSAGSSVIRWADVRDGTRASLGTSLRRPHLSISFHQVAVIVAVLLTISAASFGVLAIGERTQRTLDRGAQLSLDGTAYVDTYHPAEGEAIHWLDTHVSGQPTMVSRPGTTMYTWKNAPSSLTGIPTVAGWEHEAGYRGRQAYGARVTAVETIYQGKWSAAKWLLQQYDVSYIYYGPVERKAYGKRDFAKHAGITQVFHNQKVTIYRVDQSALDGTNEKNRGRLSRAVRAR